MIYINNKSKIEKLKNIDKFYVIIDFDRTITTRNSDPSMGVLPNYIGGIFLEERSRIFKTYRPIELDYNISTEEKQKQMKEWCVKSFELLSKYITKKIVENATNNCKMELRSGAKEFLKEMSCKDIPVIMLSGGMGNVIKSFLIKQGVLYDNIILISNFFEFENNKPIIDYNNLISTSNKNYSMIPQEIRKDINNTQKILLFGDVVEDIKMIDRNLLERTITIGFLDYNIEKNLETYKKNFDIVLTNNEGFRLKNLEVI